VRLRKKTNSEQTAPLPHDIEVDDGRPPPPKPPRASVGVGGELGGEVRRGNCRILGRLKIDCRRFLISKQIEREPGLVVVVG
jgi:hypothetical protein